MLCCYTFWGFILGILIPIIICVFTWMSRKIPNLNGKHVVITGGSQGIGKAVGIEAAKRGAHVTILARSEHNLSLAKEEIVQACVNAGEQIITDVKADVTNFEELQKKIVDIDNSRAIDILINCAGKAITGIIEDVAQEDVISLLNLNFLGTYFATKTVVPLMKKRNGGIIIMTGSQASLIGIFGYGIYSASKYALRGLAETVQMEVKPYNISVTLALPPDTDTPGFEKENIGKPLETREISSSGGLFLPDAVAKKMLDDALLKSFYSSVGFESFMLTTFCYGMAPFNSYCEVIVQSLLLGPIRLILSFYIKQFEKVVSDAKESRDKEKAANAKIENK